MDRSHEAVRIVAMAVLAGLFIIHTAGTPARSAEAQGQAEAPPGAAVFEMKYRGLDTPGDPLSYNSYWGMGVPRQVNSPFVQAVKERVEDHTLVYNPDLRGVEWAVVELKDGEPVALHFDVNGDGKPSENERFGPAAPLHRFGYPYCFITSDFAIRTQDGREVPFRVMLVGARYGSQPIMYMWTPYCVLEGQAVLDGESTRLFLYGYGFTGSFTDFGRCSFALIPADRKPDGLIGRSTLSSLINYDRHFYRLKFVGAHEKGKTLRVILEKDTTPTGQIAMRLAGKEITKSRLRSAALQGAADTTVYFQITDVQKSLPAMRYKLSAGYINYDAEDSQWQVNVNDGPEFTVEAGQTTEIDMGAPALSVRAIDERDRYRADVKERTTFANATTIYLAPQIRGKAGEIYMRFTHKGGDSGSYADVKPHYTIVDSGGKQVASGDMEYG